MTVETIAKQEARVQERHTMELEIQRLEEEVGKAKERLTEARRRLPPEEVSDYILQGPGGNPVALSDLFGEKQDLLVVHNMGQCCTYCTLWADGFNGVREHLENRSAFAVISPDSPEEQARFAASRGWTFRMCSSKGSTFTQDMDFQMEDGPWPGVSAFHKELDGRITRVAKTFLGPGDDFCSVWHLFGLLADGDNGWQPKLKY